MGQPGAGRRDTGHTGLERGGHFPRGDARHDFRDLTLNPCAAGNNIAQLPQSESFPQVVTAGCQVVALPGHLASRVEVAGASGPAWVQTHRSKMLDGASFSTHDQPLVTVGNSIICSNLQDLFAPL